jgi:CRP/FNR family transcriptional regulator
MRDNPSKGPSCFVENQHVSCFELLTEDEKQMIEMNRLVVNYKKGETIAKQGSFASHIIFLNQGLVKVYLEGNPKDLILKIVPSNHLIGLPSIYDGNNRFIYSVATYTDSSVSLIDISLFKQLLRSNSQFAMKIINILNEDTALIYGRFFCLTMKQSHGRVADILLCLAQRVYKTKVFDLAISRSDLADLTGLSSESVIRILKEFKDEGLINIEGKRFEVIDFEKLEKISSLS